VSISRRDKKLLIYFEANGQGVFKEKVEKIPKGLSLGRLDLSMARKSYGNRRRADGGVEDGKMPGQGRRVGRSPLALGVGAPGVFSGLGQQFGLTLAGSVRVVFLFSLGLILAGRVCLWGVAI